MNWTRYKLLIISGGITVVASGVLIFWILSSRGESSEISNQIRSLSNQQSQLFSQKPYPSEKNFEKLIAEQEKVVEQRDQLRKIIEEGELTPVEVSRSRFGDFVSGELVPGLRELAQNSKKGGEHGVILSDPDFGYTQYLSGTLPETARIPQLLLEMETIKHMSTLLFEAGISQLNSIKTVEDENAGLRVGRPSAPTGMPGFGVPLQNQRQPVAETEGKSKVLQEKERLFDWVDYRLEFRVYEDFFWEIMNKIVNDPNQLVLTELYVTNSNEKLWPKYLEPVLGKGEKPAARTPRPRPAARRDDLLSILQGSTSDEAEETEDKDVRIPGLEDRRQHVVGGDLLNVVMVVRVYRLKDQAQAAAEGI
ncbi:MAG: hypothetical protein ACO3N7_00930 [Kiritimatiellia bacterium]